jgi:hypothetical protein
MFEIFGIVISPTMWIVTAIIIGVIGLIICGYYYDGSDDGPLIVLEVFTVGLMASFWPIATIIIIAVGILSLPVLLGKYIKKLKSERDKAKEEKLKHMADAERILKK